MKRPLDEPDARDVRTKIKDAFRRPWRQVRGALFSVLLRCLRQIFRRLPLSTTLALGRAGGVVAWAVLWRPRRLAYEHLALALPDADIDRGRIVRAVFTNAGQNLTELLAFDRIRPRLREYVAMRGLENMHEALAARRGVVAVATHLGSWEMLAAAACEHGLPVAVVGRRPRERALFELLESLRTSYGAETIWRESQGAAKQLLSTLRRNRILALLIDQDTRRVPQVVAPFFGRPARTPSGAATLALRTGAPLVPVFIHRTESGHEVEFEAAIDPADFTGPGAVVDVTAALNRAIERRIRACPEEWVWWHRRWRL